MTTAIVAGGGVAGLLAAKLLKRQHDRVLLVERDVVCGGLMGSITNADGVSFDHGAHVLSETGVVELDSLMYGDLDQENWRAFRVLKAGNWFGGAMNHDSPFPDARCRLDAEELRRALDELARAASTQYSVPAANLAEVLVRRFGPTLATQVAGMATRKQLPGVALEDLHPDTPFAIRRLICADAGESRRLKEEARFAEALAYASYEEGVRSLHHYYPRNGGLGQWVESFVSKLQREGVEAICNRTIASVGHVKGRVQSVLLDDGRRIECDVLAWTLPSALLLRAAGIPFNGKSPPVVQPLSLFHLVFDKPFETDNYHITCYDELLRTYRITLYPNLRDKVEQGPHNCTVEVIGDAGADGSTLLSRVIEELRLMGIIVSGAQLVSSMCKIIPVGFPLTTHEFMRNNAMQAALAREHLGNILLLGRARCPPFLTTDVLVDAYNAIEAFPHERRPLQS